MDWVQTKLAKRVDWAPGLSTFCFDQALDFDAGQWVNISAELKGERVRRAYSIASAPGAPVELFITEVEGGALSPSLFDLEIGQSLQMENKARGFFTLEHVPSAEELWLVGTGTGVAPYISMLRNGAVLDRYATIVVVHGVRHGVHLAYAEEICDFRTASGAVRYVPIVSRDAEKPGIVPGRITNALQSGALERAAEVKLDPARTHMMICGNPDMIKELMTLLGERGLKRHKVREPGHITIERYW